MSQELSQASEAGAEEVTTSAVEQAQEEQQPQQGAEAESGAEASDADSGEAEAAGDDVAENQDADGF
jgi:hypothetical protein